MSNSNSVAPHSDGANHEKLILDSWARCRDYGLTPSTQPELHRPSAGDVGVLLEAHQFLVQTTYHEVLPYYEHILSNSHCLIMLADGRGQLLQSWGDQRFLEPGYTQGFEAGTSWIERYTGTNAIGTALATGQAIQIHRDEHFLKANRFMTGSAAPIFDASRSLIGVLDVSSDTYLPQTHTLGMVKMMTQSVENRLIINLFKGEHFFLTFNTNLDSLDSQWAGILVFTEQGQVISANRRADILLGLELWMVNIESLFDTTLRNLINHPEGLPMQLTASGKYRFYATVKRPVHVRVIPRDFRQNHRAATTEPAKPSVPLREVPLPNLLAQHQRLPANQPFTLDAIDLGDPRISKAVRQAKRILDKDIPILIHGETGVGKEVFVKALHETSDRAAYPLVAVNCAAIPGDLVESELFGYEKGAFTGASQKGSMGLIRKAHKGTLFLDELGDMPLKVQARLLRVLQERKVTPLGSTESYPVDIRLVSATNRSLKTDVEQGLFRQDLYYRVTGLNLELPPLRERQDKTALFHALWDRYREADQESGLSEEVLALFHRHPWPGNVRQLVSVLQIALAMADTDLITAEHLPDDFFADLQEQPHVTVPTTLTAETAAEAAEMGETSEAEATPANEPPFPEQSLPELYQHYEGNISMLARHLGISRTTLYKRLKEFGLHS